MGSLVRAQPGEHKNDWVQVVGPFFMYFVYILYSPSSNIYYVGHSDDVDRRVNEHNNPVRTKFTSKHLPWQLVAVIEISNSRGEAMKAESYIKKRKSRKYIEKLIKVAEEREKLARWLES